jgi:LDH2 family malate/lactate/ureidoglycolate dehydrogenase
MNMSYENALNLAYRGLQAAGIAQAAAFETAQFLVLAEADGLASHGLVQGLRFNSNSAEAQRHYQHYRARDQMTA